MSFARIPTPNCLICINTCRRFRPILFNPAGASEIRWTRTGRIVGNRFQQRRSIRTSNSPSSTVTACTRSFSRVAGLMEDGSGHKNGSGLRCNRRIGGLGKSARRIFGVSFCPDPQISAPASASTGVLPIRNIDRAARRSWPRPWALIAAIAREIRPIQPVVL